MKKNQIKIKKIQQNTIGVFTIKNGMVYDSRGKNPVYCSCTGNTVETATPMQYNESEGVYCPHCHEKKVEVLQTYDEWKTEKDEKAKKLNEEKLANLHLVEAGSDWECGFKYYTLSAQIDYNDWLKVKEHFKYYQKGWSRGQELEWNYGEPTGWLTTTPIEVEKILVKIGLIKPENTMEAISERKAEEKAKKEEKQKENLAKRQEIKAKMDEIDAKIQEAFNSSEKRELSDAEANEHYFNADFGKNNVCSYRITNGEIIKCNNMGDFKYGVAVPFSEYLKQLIENFYYFDKQLWNYF